MQPPRALHYSIKPADCVSQSDGPGLDIDISYQSFNFQFTDFTLCNQTRRLYDRVHICDSIYLLVNFFSFLVGLV